MRKILILISCKTVFMKLWNIWDRNKFNNYVPSQQNKNNISNKSFEKLDSNNEMEKKINNRINPIIKSEIEKLYSIKQNENEMVSKENIPYRSMRKPIKNDNNFKIQNWGNLMQLSKNNRDVKYGSRFKRDTSEITIEKKEKVILEKGKIINDHILNMKNIKNSKIKDLLDYFYSECMQIKQNILDDIILKSEITENEQQETNSLNLENKNKPVELDLAINLVFSCLSDIDNTVSYAQNETPNIIDTCIENSYLNVLNSVQKLLKTHVSDLYIFNVDEIVENICSNAQLCSLFIQKHFKTLSLKLKNLLIHISLEITDQKIEMIKKIISNTDDLILKIDVSDKYEKLKIEIMNILKQDSYDLSNYVIDSLVDIIKKISSE
ncbi:hypothetical protein EDEG_00578 [Edhazardia aedis USNM 41457]|uniref:Uncharacterized protein n=1 Tax=Edhazardia aedis (strain USNM 41457) TaxID=1003232 RepID=J9DS27_EDHAE|nr:hypothetical protein EDEG_00578 [Edhazardia aedis USNM 41457]|eukprot:EJW05380.1 hypothetical protein EDEG_00578 [Edhazardia aedis USNM 41457]